MTTYGYARVSTADQKLDRQLEALSAAGCDQIYQEKVGGASEERPELEKILAIVGQNDTIVVTSLDRFGRSLGRLIAEIDSLEKRGVSLVSLQEQIDTTTATGKFILHTFAILAEYERNRIRDRTMQGLKTAKAQGRIGGRPTKQTADVKVKALKMLRNGMTKDETARALSISRATLYRMIKESKV